MKKKSLLLGCVVLVMIIFAALFLGKKENAMQENTGLLTAIENYQGFSRTVSKEEYDFYAYFVERDLSKEVSAEELDHLVKEYANEVNAVFYLANRYKVCYII